MTNQRNIGDYSLIAPLGEGGMARVHLAIKRGPAGFNKLLVIKEIRSELADQEEFAAMFMDEARLAARLNHPNVVQTIEVGESRGRRFITMEFLDGQPLNAVLKRVKRKNAPLDEHIWILTKVLAGLHYAHELTDFDGTPLNVVHRDVSPQNVFITYDGQVKLVDFGIAKAAGAINVTKKGVFKGKIGYGAPEQLTRKPADRRADVFAVGVMLWEAIARRRLAVGDDIAGIIFARVSGDELQLTDVVPDVDEQLATICNKALAIDPEQRFATALAMQVALEEYLELRDHSLRPRDVGEFVASRFADERQAMRQRIDEAIGDADVAAEPSEDVMGAQEVAEPTPAPPSGSTVGGVEVADPASSAVGLQPNRSQVGWVALAAAIVVLAGVVAVVLTRSASPTESGNAALAATDDVPEQVAAAPPVTVTHEVDAAKGRATLSIAVLPSVATIILDGTTVAGNPYEAQIVRGAQPHIVRAEAPGFVAEERIVTLLEDEAITIQLRPDRASQKPTGSSDAADVAAAPKPASTGTLHKKAGKAGRAIDTSNPYAR